VLSAQGQSLILAGALISIALNPLLFAASEPARRWIRQRSQLARKLDRTDDPLAELPMSTDAKFLKNQVVIVGYGRVGKGIAMALKVAWAPQRPLSDAMTHRQRMAGNVGATVC